MLTERGRLTSAGLEKIYMSIRCGTNYLYGDQMRDFLYDRSRLGTILGLREISSIRFCSIPTVSYSTPVQLPIAPGDAARTRALAVPI
jgi:hypothetical protein